MEESYYIEYPADYQIVSATTVVELTEKVMSILEEADNEWQLNGAPFSFDGKIHQCLFILQQEMVEDDEEQE